MRTSETIAQISAALAKAQGTFKNPEADASNPYFGSKYADLAGVIDAVRTGLAAQDIAVIQSPETVPGEGSRMFVRMVTRLVHKSGEWFEDDAFMVEGVRRRGKKGSAADEEQVVAGPPNAQDMGSAVTYLRRYSLAAMVGVAQTEEDDDGNGASGRPHAREAGPAGASASRPAGSQMKEPASDATADQLYSAIMVLLNDTMVVNGQKVTTIKAPDRAAYKHDADEARTDPGRLRHLYEAVKVAVLSGRGGGVA